MMQDLDEIKAIYVAWALGAEIEVNNPRTMPDWEEHESFDEVGEYVDSYFIWMIVHDTYDSLESEDRCKHILFRLKSE